MYIRGVYTRDMTTTTWITFHTNKNGKRYATKFYRGRNFHMPLAEAELMIALGTGTEEPEVKW